MAAVSLHVYDVTNSPNARTNNIILNINRVSRDALGIGGIFHGAVEVYGEEWSFGFCERGSGVFSCPPKSNPMYTFRETIELGVTGMDERSVEQLLEELSQKWRGRYYDLLNRNCNHFCDELCVRLGVGPIPAWVNRFAYAGDAALDFYDQTSTSLSQFRTAMFSASQSAYQYFFPTAYGTVDDSSKDTAQQSSQQQSSSTSAVNGVAESDAEGDEKRRTALPVCPTIQGQS